jgi:surface protein
VTKMYNLFSYTKKFNQNISTWDVSNVVNMEGMFRNAWAFEKKFNNKNPLPNDTNELKVWFNNNRDKMLAIDIKEREKDNLDSFYNNLESLYNNLDKENMH